MSINISFKNLLVANNSPEHLVENVYYYSCEAEVAGFSASALFVGLSSCRSVILFKHK